MSNALYVIHPGPNPRFPICVTREGILLCEYDTVESAYTEWCYYKPIVWDEPLPIKGERLDYDPEAVEW
jgi:hypothetical protein